MSRLIQLIMQVSDIRIEKAKNGGDPFQAILSDDGRREGDNIRKCADGDQVAGNRMQIGNRVKIKSEIPEFPVCAGLFESGLRQPLIVFPIRRIRPDQKGLAVLPDFLTGNDGSSVSAAFLGEGQMIGPRRKGFFVLHIEGNANLRYGGIVVAPQLGQASTHGNGRLHAPANRNKVMKKPEHIKTFRLTGAAGAEEKHPLFQQELGKFHIVPVQELDPLNDHQGTSYLKV